MEFHIVEVHPLIEIGQALRHGTRMMVRIDGPASNQHARARPGDLDEIASAGPIKTVMRGCHLLFLQEKSGLPAPTSDSLPPENASTDKA
jgi:hypothetical protein